MKINLHLLVLSILLPFAAFSQYTISGSVNDSLKNSIVGARITVSQTYIGTLSDAEGNYAMSGLSDGTYIIVTDQLGFETTQQSVTISGANVEVDLQLKKSVVSLDEITIEGSRVSDNAPFVHVNIDKKDIESSNLGQDIAFLLQSTPSIVSTSDAGSGVGYTGFRIRGSDATRINVTVNGIPMNDAESHGVYWVNMPDFASSTESIQIQRGVGSSTNGTAAFGASVNMKTDLVSKESYGEVSSSFGSFNTNKNTLKLGTGLLNKRWAIDGRLSSITSDGYIDRASSDLSSYYLSGGYYGKKTVVKAITFAGKEKTYQSWYGTPEAKINGNDAGIQASIANNWFGAKDAANLVSSGRTYNYYTYDNEVDNYNQDHYQLHLTHQFNNSLSLTAAAHYTYGRGYYEQFKAGKAFTTYGLDSVFTGNDTITNSDFILRRWLENHFYGGVFSLKYKTKKLNVIAGGGLNQYVGDHFGEIIWAQYSSNSNIRDRYYDNTGTKTDANFYTKADYSISKKIALFVDLQIRSINYDVSGIDNGLGSLSVDTAFVFFNPKAGINYQINDKIRTYASFSVGNREPVRSDFIDNPKNDQPSHETLFDYEAGVEAKFQKMFVQGNFYFMDYTNQLVLTGALTDVGSGIRVNTPKSYRAGFELVAGFKIHKKLDLTFNATFSQNKIKEYTELIVDYATYATIENKYKNSDIAFSPSVIAASILTFRPVKGIEMTVRTKYVGDQYLDNTGSDDRKLKAYTTTDLGVSYSLKLSKLKEIQFNALINNVLNEMYSSNGYTWGFLYAGERTTENWLYPQAGTNFLAGVTLKF
jgi:iron complex outermembrane receptor protein